MFVALSPILQGLAVGRLSLSLKRVTGEVPCRVSHLVIDSSGFLRMRKSRRNPEEPAELTNSEGSTNIFAVRLSPVRTAYPTRPPLGSKVSVSLGRPEEGLEVKDRKASSATLGPQPLAYKTLARQVENPVSHSVSPVAMKSSARGRSGP
ncbi:hypothetical protein GGX14DRAFT_587549 [Mycena pura]|uniref:Uncharacterized protein n=1 Tax=Mycena pura TaxID=153505 RepID=A0AAD6Y4H3_9AGAR|nr:hypothetical protein GGX14DRAFT_587549 [Mycena pura]